MEISREVPVQNLQRTGGFVSAKADQKFFDTTLAATVAAAAGTIANASLNLIPQNATESGRIGNRVKVTSIHLRGSINLPGTAVALASDMVRVIVYLDRQANGATAAVTDILATADYRSFNNMANKGRFQTLMDEYCAMNYQAADSVPTAYSYRKELVMNKKGLGIALQFSGATGAITEVRTNNVGVLIIGLIGGSTVEYIARVRYDDL